MGPIRKSRSVNKRFSDYVGLSPDKDVLGKRLQRKRKLSDMLGLQWDKEELERFYEAYRKYGKDWKKVAGVLRSRTVDMVEALYNMNRAYLSLPEGTASVVGLIAMMTDHYNVLDGNNSDREKSDASRLSHKPQRRGRGKVQLSGLKEELLQSQLGTSSEGCLSLLKRRPSDGCAVGKRTPRFPISISLRKGDSSPNIRGSKSMVDNDVAHVAALALTEASQGGGTPQISQSSYRTDRSTSSPLKSWERMSEMDLSKLCGIMKDQDYTKGSMGRRVAENEDYAKHASGSMDTESVGTVEGHRKRKKVSGRRVKVEVVGVNKFDDGREACSDTEGVYVGDLKGNAQTEVTYAKVEQFSSQGRRKRNKKHISGDESSALDALQTLADLSLMMQPSGVQCADRLSVAEAVSTSQQRENIKLSSVRERELLVFSKAEASTSGKSNLGREPTIDISVLAEVDQQPQPPNTPWRRQSKSSVHEVLEVECHTDPHLREPSKIRAFAEAEGTLCTAQTYGPSEQWESRRPADCSSLGSDQTRIETDSAVLTSQVPTKDLVIVPTKRKSRRKMDPKRVPINKEMKSSEVIFNDWPYKYSTLQEKGMLSCPLSSYMVRRWCTFEWFYSAIDYPWFAKREFDEYLSHVRLGHIPRLTRVEWGVIRSSLGKPRRFCENFLHEEREKLKQYRQSVRKHYSELRAGVREGLPTDLARPLSVGQRVIAIHPKSREVHDGRVLTVDHDKCRIQFDRPELGVEFVMDIDCLPLNPLENMPEALRRQNIPIDRFSARTSAGYTLSENLENVESAMNTKSAKVSYGQPCSLVHIHAREADIFGLSELTRALDKKEAILMELKHVNNDLLKSRNTGDSFLKDSEPFRKQYAMLLQQLKEVSDQVSSALLNLRQRNTYPVNSLPPWPKAPAMPSGLLDPLDRFSTDPQEFGSNVVGIVTNSRSKAQTMVAAAIQAISSLKEGEDAFARLGEALDSSSSQNFPPDSVSLINRSPDQVSGFTPMPEPMIGHASGPMLPHDFGKSEGRIPSALVSSCVASLLMIQTCTERQPPPADVAHILDSAVTNLRPCCPQNLPIYREIQMCMGRIRTQILALVPA